MVKQREVQEAGNLLEVLQDTKKGAKTIEIVQQLYGDMVLDVWFHLKLQLNHIF